MFYSSSPSVAELDRDPFYMPYLGEGVFDSALGPYPGWPREGWPGENAMALGALPCPLVQQQPGSPGRRGRHESLHGAAALCGWDRSHPHRARPCLWTDGKPEGTLHLLPCSMRRPTELWCSPSPEACCWWEAGPLRSCSHNHWRWREQRRLGNEVSSFFFFLFFFFCLFFEINPSRVMRFWTDNN